MKLGVYTAILHDRPLPEALDVVASLGLTGAEVNAGGFLPSPHLPVGDLLDGSVSTADYLATFERAGVALTGLNVNGNVLHPDPAVSGPDTRELRQAIEVAGLLGVTRVVAMSGLPAASAG
jgi:sugar phosphate isomerase/epimerase